jgi:single-stranded-DNA-specific exonuclease
VAFKLAQAFRSRVEASTGPSTQPPDAHDSGLDLVALATVADLVPLRDENRALVRRGLVTLRRAERPGIRALVAAAGIEPERLDEGDIAFRLAPRINAAGRLYRADAAVELLLSTETDRAEEIAAELNAANRERRSTETDVLHGAEKALRELPDEASAQSALVLAGEGWHAGVVGIVASRLAERHWRPTVLIALDGNGGGRGSGRSIPGFDLLAGLEACSEHLVRFGGHKAAAGLEIKAEDVAAFRDAFAAYAATELDSSVLTKTSPVDAVVGSDGLGIELAEQLERLAPFGAGNPRVRLLVPAARVRDIRPMGQDDAHARFMIESGTRRASGVAFNINGELKEAEQAPHDLGVGLEVNRWNGAEHPRAVLRDIYRIDGDRLSAAASSTDDSGTAGAAPESLAGCPCAATGAEWWSRFDSELGADPAGWPHAPGAVGESQRSVVEAHEASTVARLAELVSSGASVLAVCADAARRQELVAGAANPERFGSAAAVLACRRCETAAREAVGALSDHAGLALCDWSVLRLDPSLSARFPHVVLVDPPPFPQLEDLVGNGDGYLHRCWAEQDLALALRVHDAEWDTRPALGEVFRALRGEDGGVAEGDRLIEILAGLGRFPRAPESAGRCVRVLEELGLITRPSGDGHQLRVVSSERTELERSAAYVAFRDRHEEGTQFLEKMRHQL